MEAEASLEMFRAEKVDIRKEDFYDNSKGSALLLEAREGCLRTKRLWESIQKRMGYAWSAKKKQ